MYFPEYPAYIQDIMRRFAAAGEQAFIVGGCLRDALLGKTPDDYDMATSALPDKTMEIFSDKRLITNGLKHGTVTVIIDSHPVEITTFRVDGEYTDSRHPSEVKFTVRIEDDLSRRDFTVNAMAYSRERGLVDPFGGQRDLERKLICAVGDPERRFDEDALRIMRAFRFAAQLGFKIDGDTLAGAHKKRDGLANIARERIGVEFIKLLTAPCPAPIIDQMADLEILPFVCKDIVLSERIMKSIGATPRTPSARLGILLSDTPVEVARDILWGLRASAKISHGAISVIEGSKIRIESMEDAGRFAARFGGSAVEAAIASELLENSILGASDMVLKWQTLPHTIGDLAAGGADMISIGAVGKEIGEVLKMLLDAVIAAPECNEKEILLELAKKYIIKLRESEDK